MAKDLTNVFTNWPLFSIINLNSENFHFSKFEIFF